MNRGGSWNNTPQNCRVSYRNNNDPQNRNNNRGFRLVWSPSSRESRTATSEQMIVPSRNGQKGDLRIA